MNSYNNTVHRITKNIPYEIFYSTNNELFTEVYIYFEFYKKTQKNKIIYNSEEKALLVNNILKSKNKNKKGYYSLILNKVKKNKSLYITYLLVKKNLNNGSYLIEIKKENKKYIIKS